MISEKAILSLKDGTARYRISETETTIGRGSDNDINIADIMMARRHAVVCFHDPSLFIVDFHATNGTFLDHVRLDPGVPYLLRDGAELRCANTEFIINLIK